MELKVFRRAAVAAELEQYFIEARLHTDDGVPNIERTRERQATLTNSVANPYYVIVDPATERPLGKLEGARTPGAFLDWLEKARALYDDTEQASSQGGF